MQAKKMFVGDQMAPIQTRQQAEKQQLDNLEQGAYEVWNRDFGGKTFATALNPLLRTYTNRDQAVNIHVTNVAQRGVTNAQLCQLPLGEWLKLASFLAHPNNLYLIPKSCNTYKSHIPFDLYKDNVQSVEGDFDQQNKLAFIKGYLKATIDGDQITVADRMRALCTAMKSAQGNHYTGLTREAGACLEAFLHGLSKESIKMGFYDAKH